MASEYYRLIIPPIPAMNMTNWEEELKSWRQTRNQQRQELEALGVTFHESLSQTMSAYKISVPADRLSQLRSLSYVVSCDPLLPDIIMREHDDNDMAMWIVELNPVQHVKIRDWLTQRHVNILPAMRPTLTGLRCLAPVRVIRELRAVPGIQRIDEWIPATITPVGNVSYAK